MKTRELFEKTENWLMANAINIDDFFNISVFSGTNDVMLNAYNRNSLALKLYKSGIKIELNENGHVSGRLEIPDPDFPDMPFRLRISLC